MPLFHCTHLLLNSISIIEPGNWGRILSEIGATHPCWEREQILERIRAQLYPSKPSRLKSAFACESEKTIRCYKSVHNPQGLIYKVEVVDETLPTHTGDFNCVEPLPRLNKTMEEIAHHYWRYDLKTNVESWPGVVCSEFVTLSSLRVLEHIE